MVLEWLVSNIAGLGLVFQAKGDTSVTCVFVVLWFHKGNMTVWLAGGSIIKHDLSVVRFRQWSRGDLMTCPVESKTAVNGSLGH